MSLQELIANKIFQSEEEANLYFSFIKKALEGIGINKSNFREDQRLCFTYNKDRKSWRFNFSFGTQNWLVIRIWQEEIIVALFVDFLKGYNLIHPNQEDIITVSDDSLPDSSLILSTPEIQLFSVNGKGDWHFQGKRFDKAIVLPSFSKQAFKDNLEILQTLFIKTLKYAELFSNNKTKKNANRKRNNNLLLEAIFDGNENYFKEIEEENITPFQLEKLFSDNKKVVTKESIQREGQKEFRNSLLKAYSQRCCISNCKVEKVLEAAHIVPYSGLNSNYVQNGLLLRADLHKLFDDYQISINPKSLKVKIHEKLIDSEYFSYSEKQINLPKCINCYPHKEALKVHYERFLQK